MSGWAIFAMMALAAGKGQLRVSQAKLDRTLLNLEADDLVIDASLTRTAAAETAAQRMRQLTDDVSTGVAEMTVTGFQFGTDQGRARRIDREIEDANRDVEAVKITSSIEAERLEQQARNKRVQGKFGVRAARAGQYLGIASAGLQAYNSAGGGAST